MANFNEHPTFRWRSRRGGLEGGGGGGGRGGAWWMKHSNKEEAINCENKSQHSTHLLKSNRQTTKRDWGNFSLLTALMRSPLHVPLLGQRWPQRRWTSGDVSRDVNSSSSWSSGHKRPKKLPNNVDFSTSIDADPSVHFQASINQQFQPPRIVKQPQSWVRSLKLAFGIVELMIGDPLAHFQASIKQQFQPLRIVKQPQSWVRSL